MARLLRLAALAACLAGVADAFKRDEMKKCEQLHFCRSERQRGAAPAVASAPVVDPSTGDVVAGVAQADGSAAELRLGAVPGGSLRVRLLEPGAGRYELGGVLLPQVTAAQGGGWAGVAADAAAPGVYALTPASPDGPRARLTLSPLKIELARAPGWPHPQPAQRSVAACWAGPLEHTPPTCT